MVRGHDISDRLIGWYTAVRRDLPWRETTDPYRIWLSEVILQQTRVAQGLDYYLRFVERFPDVQALARADEDEVLKLWQGLGYYSRARNLHTAAREVAERYGGRSPARHGGGRAARGAGGRPARRVGTAGPRWWPPSPGPARGAGRRKSAAVPRWSRSGRGKRPSRS